MIWPAIVTAVVTGGMGLVTLFWGPYRGLKSTDQLRWVLAVLVFLGMSFGSGAVALDLGNSNPTTTKQIYYASHIINSLAIVGLVTIATLAVFADFGARLILPALALIAGVFMCVGVFPINSHFDVGFFSLVAGICVALSSFLVFFVDRMDILPKLPTSEREPVGRFNGLGWRIGVVIALWLDFILWNLTVDTYGTVWGLTASQVVWMGHNLFASIFIMANWIIAQGIEPVYDGTGFSNRESAASDNGHGAYSSKRRGGAV